MKNIILLTLVLLAAGCASTGTKFDAAQVQTIERGQTTRSELETRFGKPMAVGFDGDGRQTATWIYSHARSQAQSFIPIAGAFVGGVDVQMQQLVVLFDAAGVVSDYNYNDSANAVNYGLAR